MRLWFVYRFLSLWNKCKLSPLMKYVRISNYFYQNESCLLLEHSWEKIVSEFSARHMPLKRDVELLKRCISSLLLGIRWPNSRSFQGPCSLLSVSGVQLTVTFWLQQFTEVSALFILLHSSASIWSLLHALIDLTF